MREINETGMKRALLINDLSCMGKCSLGVAVPVVSSYGVEAVPLPTAMLSMQTCFEGYAFCDMTEQMKQFIAHWKKMNVKFDCIFTGFFGNVGQIEMTIDFIRDFARPDTLVLVDPVIGDNGALYGFFGDEYIEAMRKLVSMAHVTTPNRTEAALLAGCSMDAPAEEIMDSLTVQLSVPNAVITSVRFDDSSNDAEQKIGYLARSAGQPGDLAIATPLRPYKLRGTGDVFASALCGELMADTDRPGLSDKLMADAARPGLRGELMADTDRPGLSGPLPSDRFFHAVQGAADFCSKCIDATVKKQPGHWYGLAYEDVIAAKR